MSIGAAFALVVFPPACEMTLLVSELAFATRAMREAIEQGGSLPVCLSICVQRAALKAPPPFGRTLSFQNPLRASARCGLLAPGKLGSLSADSVQSPWEWVATAHPPGNVWSAARLQAKSSDDEKWSAAMYSACDEAIASGHDVLRALLFLSSMSASSALPKDRLQAGPI
jgi:hypothetical protein